MIAMVCNIPQRAHLPLKNGAVRYGINQKFAAGRSPLLGVWGAHSPPFLYYPFIAYQALYYAY